MTLYTKVGIACLVLLFALALTGCATRVERSFETCLMFGGKASWVVTSSAEKVECQQ